MPQASISHRQATEGRGRSRRGKRTSSADELADFLQRLVRTGGRLGVDDAEEFRFGKALERVGHGAGGNGLAHGASMAWTVAPQRSTTCFSYRVPRGTHAYADDDFISLAR